MILSNALADDWMEQTRTEHERNYWEHPMYINYNPQRRCNINNYRKLTKAPSALKAQNEI